MEERPTRGDDHRSPVPRLPRARDVHARHALATARVRALIQARRR